MKRIMPPVVMGVIVLETDIASGEELVPVGLQKQLLVDDNVIAEKRDVTREADHAKKHGVVMEPTLPTDFQSGKVHDGPDGDYGFESPFCWFWSPHTVLNCKTWCTRVKYGSVFPQP